MSNGKQQVTNSVPDLPPTQGEAVFISGPESAPVMMMKLLNKFKGAKAIIQVGNERHSFYQQIDQCCLCGDNAIKFSNGKGNKTSLYCKKCADHLAEHGVKFTGLDPKFVWKFELECALPSSTVNTPVANGTRRERLIAQVVEHSLQDKYAGADINKANTTTVELILMKADIKPVQ